MDPSGTGEVMEKKVGESRGAIESPGDGSAEVHVAASTSLFSPSGGHLKQDSGPEVSLLASPQCGEGPGRHCTSWEEAVAAYGQVRAGISAMLEHVLCLDFAEKVRLALSKHQEKAIVTVERIAFSEWLGREVHWEPRCEHEGETLSQVRIREAEASQKKLEQAAREDTHVQALMREFGAKLEHVHAPGAAILEEQP